MAVVEESDTSGTKEIFSLDSRGSSRILMDLQTRRNTIPMMMASKSIIQVVEAKNTLLQYNTLNSIANETEFF
jgi:hypothetical protein